MEDNQEIVTPEFEEAVKKPEDEIVEGTEETVEVEEEVAE